MHRTSWLGPPIALGVVVTLAVPTDRSADHPALVTTPLAPPPGFITESNFGARWPFTVPSGVLRCDGTSAIVFTADGVGYAVNGPAARHGYRRLEEIWKKRDSGVGHVDLTEIIDRGRRLCP